MTYKPARTITLSATQKMPELPAPEMRDGVLYVYSSTWSDAPVTFFVSFQVLSIKLLRGDESTSTR